MIIHKRRTNTRKYVLIASLVVLAVAAVLTVLELTNVTHIFHKRPVQSASQFTKGEPATANSTASDTSGSTATQSTSASGSDASSSAQPGDQKSDSGGNNTAESLVAPSGDFVSNHHPNLGGSPAPNTLTSVCTTTPGASCKITFTKGSTVVSLPSQDTDRGGSTYWNNWKLQDIGLTAGSWQVKAVATLNGKDASTDDALSLEVAQ